jgi:hypothetical protein
MKGRLNFGKLPLDGRHFIERQVGVTHNIAPIFEYLSGRERVSKSKSKTPAYRSAAWPTFFMAIYPLSPHELGSFLGQHVKVSATPSTQ